MADSWNIGGMGEEDVVTVRAVLVGAAEFAAEADAVTAATEEMGVAAETTGKKMEGASRRSFLMSQAMFTLRRYLFYGTQALVAGGLAAVYFGLKFDSNMQQSTVALTHFLGSSQAARTELQSLYHLAAYTPFSFADVTEAAKSMLSFGFSVKDTNYNLKVMADTMSGLGLTGTAVQSFTNDIVKMAARGKLMGQDIRELVSLHIPALAILQKQLGLTATQIQNIGKAGIPSDVAIPALMRGLEEKYRGMAAKQEQTLQGRLSTLKDLTQQALGTAMMPLFEWLQNTALPITNTIVQALQTGFGHGGLLGSLQELNRSNAPFWFKTLYTFIVRVVETVKNLYETFKPLIGLLLGGLLVALYLVNTALGEFNRLGVVGQAILWGLFAAYVAYNLQTWIAAVRSAYLLVTTAIYVVTLDTLEASLIAVTAATWLWNAATTALDTVMGLLDIELWANPIGLIILAILAAAVAFGVLYWKSKTFRDFVDQTMVPGVLGFFAVLIHLIQMASHWMDILHGKWHFLPSGSGLLGSIGKAAINSLFPAFGAAEAVGGLFGGGSSSSPPKPRVKSHTVPARSQMYNFGTAQNPIEIRVPISIDRKVLGEAVAHYNQDVAARR